MPRTPPPSASLTALKNLGPRTAGWLTEVGVADAQALRRLGAPEAFRRLRATFPQVSWLALYALHGALADVHWNTFPAAVKRQMRNAVPGEVPGEVPEGGPPSAPGRGRRRGR